MLACCCLGAGWRLRWLQPQGCAASRPGCPAAAPGPACRLSPTPGAPLPGCPAGPAARLWAGPRGPAVRVPGHAAGRGAAALGVRRAGGHRADALPLPGGAGRVPRCGAAGPPVRAPGASPQARWLSGAACSLPLAPCDALLAATRPRAAACQEEEDAAEHAAGLARWNRPLTPLMPPPTRCCVRRRRRTRPSTRRGWPPTSSSTRPTTRWRGSTCTTTGTRPW